ncbi:MAG: hypothetical protein ACOYZ7_09595 [Chloroflexota bacterium]
MSAANPTLPRREKWIAAGLFLLLLLCYTYTLPRWADPNQNSRLDMIVAVVDDGTFQIDKYVDNTVDYARIDGHYYSDKAPGAAFLGIPVYAALKQVLDLPLMDGLMDRLAGNEALKATLRQEGSGLLETKVRLAIAQVALTFVAAALPSALLGVWMYRLLARFSARPWPRIVTVLGYGLLTPAFAYAGSFYGHQLSAALLFGAFYLVFTGQKPLSTGRLLIAGLLLGYSVITEYPAVLVVGILFAYTLYRLEDKRRIGWLMLGGALIAAGWMAYNTAVFGAPLELGYSHSELWTEQHETGFMSLTLPHWPAVWGITFGRFRGLFVLSPLLLLAAPGFVLWWRSGQGRAEWWVALGSAAALFLFNASSIMWWGGFAIGPRYLLPGLPFLALGLLFVFRRWGDRAWFKGLAAALALWSLIATWGLTLAEQAFPPDTIRHPLLEYAWPNWQSGNIARNLGMFLGLPGVASLLPLAAGVALLLAALWGLSREHATSSFESESRP